ncbi:hypothetical protein [Desulfomicrobium escambiense]|uniref:hypothetical protein n=1 Tax=Desulfomicrobium escambiense TaxID=29503 RepID=UPI000425E510|nr:hypothetical protein [Desulfomicrobium escambiense]
MTEKKIHGIRLTPATAKRLKVEAAKAGLPQGELLEALLILVERGQLTEVDLARAMTEHHMRGHSLPQGGPR